MARTVVVIEDEGDSRDWMVEALETDGYEVVCATNGAEGLVRLHALPSPASLILLDMRMPLLSGWDVLAALARSRPRSPVVIITAANDVNGVPAGADAVLMKPMSVEDLLAAVRRFAQ